MNNQPFAALIMQLKSELPEYKFYEKKLLFQKDQNELIFGIKIRRYTKIGEAFTIDYGIFFKSIEEKRILIPKELQWHLSGDIGDFNQEYKIIDFDILSSNSGIEKICKIVKSDIINLFAVFSDPELEFSIIYNLMVKKILTPNSLNTIEKLEKRFVK